MDPGASLWAVPNPISLARLGTGHLPSVSSKPKQASRPRGRRRKTFNIKMNKDETHSGHGASTRPRTSTTSQRRLLPGWLNAPHHHIHTITCPRSCRPSPSLSRLFEVLKKRGNIDSVPPALLTPTSGAPAPATTHLLISTPHSTT